MGDIFEKVFIESLDYIVLEDNGIWYCKNTRSNKNNN